MWVPHALVELFQISRSTVDSLREELASIKVERDSLRQQINVANIQADWMRIKVNGLELERTALLEKAYGIKLPAPEIMRAHTALGPEAGLAFSFENITDEDAKKLGISHLLS